MSAMRLPARKEPGRCRYCGCTDENACRFERGLTCSWVIPGEICSNRDCIQAEINRLFDDAERRGRVIVERR